MPSPPARAVVSRPSIFGIPFAEAGDGSAVELLSEEDQDRLVVISSLVRFRRNTVIYADGSRSNFIYNIVGGVVETYGVLPTGDRRISAFFFPRDLLGLSENGRYTGTAQTVTAVTAYRIPLDGLTNLLRRDPELDFHFLCKLCHELREAQRHAIALALREIGAKLAKFLLLLDRHSLPTVEQPNHVAIPMTRDDIADFVGLTVESVSRALHSLEKDGLIMRHGPRIIEILNRKRLERKAGEN